MPDQKIRPEAIEDALGASLRMTANANPGAQPLQQAQLPSMPTADPSASHIAGSTMPEARPALTPASPMGTVMPPASPNTGAGVSPGLYAQEMHGQAMHPHGAGAMLQPSAMPSPAMGPGNPYAVHHPQFSPQSDAAVLSSAMPPMDAMPAYDDRPAVRPSLLKRYLPWATVAATLAIFGGIVAWAYNASESTGAGGSLPIITADAGPDKIKPVQEGGLQVPNQDKEIYGDLGNGGTNPNGAVEHILPVPETPDVPAPTSPQGDGATGATNGSAEGSNTVGGSAPIDVDPSRTGTGAPAVAGKPQHIDEIIKQESGTGPSAPSDPVPVAGANNSGAPSTTAAAGTASPAPSAVATTGTAAPNATKAYRVQLASLKSEGDAQKQWQILQKSHAALLKGLQPSFVRAEVSGSTYYRIQVGPLSDRDSAASLCTKLQAQKQPCLIVKP